jgi:hypothetical protein
MRKHYYRSTDRRLFCRSRTYEVSAGKEKASENWSNFYSNIEGFTYEPDMNMF